MKVNWKKTVTMVVDVLLAVYLVLAFTAFNKPDAKAAMCQKVQIDIQDENTNGFISAADIRARLDANQLYPLNKPMMGVQGRLIEETLKRSRLCEHQCYTTHAHCENKSSQWRRLLPGRQQSGDAQFALLGRPYHRNGPHLEGLRAKLYRTIGQTANGKRTVGKPSRTNQCATR